MNIENLGYVVDIDSDWTYDIFHNESSEIETEVGQKDGDYLIDDDGDGKWDYTYSINQGISTYDEEKETESQDY